LKPTFRSACQLILVSSKEDIHDITIKYHGTVSAWHNVITEDLKALSWYSVWYPQEISIDSSIDEVFIHQGSDYFIVKGCFDATTQIWHYGGHGYDPFNIIAFKKSTKYLLLEFGLVLAISGILQLAILVLLRVSISTFLEKDAFITYLLGNLIYFLVSLIIYKYITYGKLIVFFKQESSKIYFFSVNLLIDKRSVTIIICTRLSNHKPAETIFL
jgi:hypothetical protein